MELIWRGRNHPAPWLRPHEDNGAKMILPRKICTRERTRDDKERPKNNFQFS